MRFPDILNPKLYKVLLDLTELKHEKHWLYQYAQHRESQQQIALPSVPSLITNDTSPYGLS